MFAAISPAGVLVSMSRSAKCSAQPSWRAASISPAPSLTDLLSLSIFATTSRRRCAHAMRSPFDGNGNWPELVALTRFSAVELPGIEPSTKIELTCRNADFGYAKQREMTRNDLRRRERC